LKRDLIETLKRDLYLLGLMSTIKKSTTTWDFVKSIYPTEKSKVVLNKEESYLRKVLNRWHSYGVIKKEVVDGRAIYMIDNSKIKIIRKKRHWLMIVKLPEFQILFKIKPNRTKSLENQTFC
jgi:hypothetical protein